MNDAEISDTVMGDHPITVIDLLGFEALIEPSDSSAQTKIRNLLEKLAMPRGDFELRVESQVGLTSTYIAPAVSSFPKLNPHEFDPDGEPMMFEV